MKLRKIAKYACGGKMPKRLYGGRVSVHKDTLQNGGPIDPSKMTDEELKAYIKQQEEFIRNSGVNISTPDFGMLSDSELQAYILKQKALQKQYTSELNALKSTPTQRTKAKLLDVLKAQSIQQPVIETPRESTNINVPLELFKSGGIYIKPSKRGSFTAAAKKRGKGVQEFARQVLANKGNYSSAMVKKANFARNFGGRKDLGGFLQDIAPLVSVIPGIPGVGAGVSALGNLIENMKQDDQPLYKLNQMENGGPVDPPSKDTNPYRQLKRRRTSTKNYLPTTTVISSKEDNITLNELRKAEKSTGMALGHLWNKYGNPEISIAKKDEQTIANLNQLYKQGVINKDELDGLLSLPINPDYDYLKNKITLSKNGEIIDTEEFLHELAHAKQLIDLGTDKFKEKYNRDITMYDYMSVGNSGKNNIYNIPGTLEYEAHKVLFPQLYKEANSVTPEQSGVKISPKYQHGGPVDEQMRNLKKRKQMRLGGDFKQYSAPSHEAGGQLIDANGNPTVTMPVAEIEKNENSHDGYVFSDHLKNPATGNTYAKDAKMIARQTKRNDDISKSSRILQLMKLKQSNEALRQQAEMYQAGVPKAELGLPYKQDNSLVPDFTIPSSTTPGILPILSQLRTIGGVEASPRSYPYPYQMTESVPTANVAPQVTDSVVAPVNATTPNAGLSTLNQIAAGLKGASLAFGAYDALRGSEQEQLQLPDYSKGDQYFRGLEIDFAPALNEINMGATKAIQDVSNQAGGIGARNSRVNAILSRAGKNAASVQLQQQQANAGIRAQLGSREDMKSQTTANERIRQQIAQSQNDATNRLAGRKFFSDLSQVGTSLNNIQYMNDMMKNQNENQRQALEYGLTILANKYPNFKADPSFFERLRTGTLTDADKPLFDQLVQFASNQ